MVIIIKHRLLEPLKVEETQNNDIKLHIPNSIHYDTDKQQQKTRLGTVSRQIKFLSKRTVPIRVILWPFLIIFKLCRFKQEDIGCNVVK